MPPFDKRRNTLSRSAFACSFTHSKLAAQNAHASRLACFRNGGACLKSGAICRFSGCIRFEKKLHPYRDRQQVRQFFKQKRKAHFSSSVNAVDSKPPRLPLGGNSARKARNRKQVAPLITALRAELPPGGKPWNKASQFLLNFALSKNKARGNLYQRQLFRISNCLQKSVTEHPKGAARHKIYRLKIQTEKISFRIMSARQRRGRH